MINPLIPLAGAGLLLFALTKKSSAAPSVAPKPTSALSGELLGKMQTALGRLGLNPATGTLTGAATANDVAYGKQVADELKAAGFVDASNILMGYVSKAAALLPGPYTPANQTPSGAPAVVNKPTSELSEQLKQLMAEALGKLGVSPATGKLSGAADAEAIRFGTQVVGQLDAEGYHEAAAALRKYVDEAAKNVKTPATAAPIAAAAPAGLTPEQRDYIARVLTLERDPNKVALLIDWLKTLAPSPARDAMIQMAQALTLQLANAQATAQTLDKIDQIIKSPGIAEVAAAAANTNPPFIPPTVLNPVIAPAGAPTSTPIKQIEPPPPPTPVQAAANAMMANISAIQAQYGVLGSKGKQNTALVKAFQALTKQTTDGMPGPNTYVLAAGQGGVVDLPIVMYWPKAATATTVTAYKNALGTIANAIAATGRTMDADRLRQSAARETGQAGINGPAVKPTLATTLPSKPTSVPATPIPQPTPAMLTEIDNVAKQVATHLTALIAKYGAAGAKGKQDVTLIKKFQKLAGLTQDGMPGPATYLVLAAKGATALPAVLYWPKNASAKNIVEYRKALKAIATKLGAPRSNELYTVALNEQGQSGNLTGNKPGTTEGWA